MYKENNSNRSIVSHFHLLYFGGLIFGLLLMLMYSSNQILTGDQMQMLDKGYQGAYENTWLSYGNAASAVGNIPGSLSAYVIGFPLMLWDSSWAPMLFLLLLHLFSFLLLDSVIKKVFDQKIRLIFLVLYWLNPWFLFESLLYNPSYLFFFAALHFWSAFHLREKSSFIYSFLHLLSIGMAMQLHYSWPILAVISTYLFYRNIIKINWLGIVSAAAVIFISLVPYFQETFFNSDLVSHPGDKEGDRYIGWGGVHVYPVFKAFLYWFRYASFLFTNKVVLGANFEWVSSIESLQNIVMYLWRTIVFVIGGASLWIVWKSNLYAWKQIRKQLFRTASKQTLTQENWLLLYTIGVLLGIFISAVLSPIVFSYWHLVIIFPFALFPLLLFLNHWLKTHSIALVKYLMLITLYFTFINLIAAHDSEKFSYKVDYVQQTLKFKEQQPHR